MKSIPTHIRSLLRFTSVSQHALIVAAIAIAVSSRLLPHPPNFTPLAAIGLFAGAISLRPAVAAGTILVAMLVSDLFLGFHSLMPVVYGCLLLSLMIGSRFVRQHDGFEIGIASCGRIVAGSLIGSILFFIVTNFAVFVTSYPATGSGLMACYAAALPFFQYTVTGDLVYSCILFGAFALCTAPSNSPERVSVGQ